MEEALVARLLASAGVSALVGTRIHWIDRPQAEALPAVTLQLVSASRSYTFQGPCGLSGSRVQFDSWGRTYAEAKTLARAIRDEMEPPATQDDIEFSASFLDSEQDMPTEDIAGGVKVHRVSQDFFVWWKVSAGS